MGKVHGINILQLVRCKLQPTSSASVVRNICYTRAKYVVFYTTPIQVQGMLHTTDSIYICMYIHIHIVHLSNNARDLHMLSIVNIKSDTPKVQ